MEQAKVGRGAHEVIGMRLDDAVLGMLLVVWFHHTRRDLDIGALPGRL